MALIRTGPYGASYAWGFSDDDKPLIPGFSALSAELKWEPEIKAEARDSQGTIVSVVRTKRLNRKAIGKFTGTIETGCDAGAIAESFPFEGRFYIVMEVSDPRIKDDFTYVTLTAESFAKITSDPQV